MMMPAVKIPPPLDGINMAISGGYGVYGAYSLSRKLVSTYNGSLYATDANGITSVNNQGVGSGNLTRVNGSGGASYYPKLGTGGERNRACMEYLNASAGSWLGGYMQSSATIGNYINQSGSTVLASFMKVGNASVSDSAVDVYLGDGLWGDIGSYYGMHITTEESGSDSVNTSFA
jgi:hypothetical protein